MPPFGVVHCKSTFTLIFLIFDLELNTRIICLPLFPLYTSCHEAFCSPSVHSVVVQIHPHMFMIFLLKCEVLFVGISLLDFISMLHHKKKKTFGYLICLKSYLLTVYCQVEQVHYAFSCMKYWIAVIFYFSVFFLLLESVCFCCYLQTREFEY